MRQRPMKPRGRSYRKTWRRRGRWVVGRMLSDYHHHHFYYYYYYYCCCYYYYYY